MMRLQQEMECRIKMFHTECDNAIRNILLLKEHAGSFLENLPKDKFELRDRFLSSTKKLNEYMYFVTELNLTLNGLEKDIHTDQISKENVLPCAVTSADCEVSGAEWNKEMSENAEKDMHTDQISNEDVLPYAVTSADCEVSGAERNKEMSENADVDPVGLSLPPQPELTPGCTIQAVIMTVDAANIWIIEDAHQLVKLTEDITEYYKKHRDSYRADIPPFSYCVYYDEDDTKSYFRALHINTETGAGAGVYLADTGESRRVSVSLLFQLASRFCVTPPLARCCHLLGVELSEDNGLLDKQVTILDEYLWRRYSVKMETEPGDEGVSLGVYVYLEDGTTLNDRLTRELYSDSEQNLFGQADNDATLQDVENGMQEEHSLYRQRPGSRGSVEVDDELDYSDAPEYENPVEAVTGYDNRDEVDICKHYKGGNGCFKGTKCKQRHVMIRPDGITLDRVEVLGKIRAAALPAPGTWHKVRVTHVDDTSRFYVHFEQEDDPMTLADLVDEMTRFGANAGRLQLEPAMGELVSARFTDGRWYRARVTGGKHRGGTIEVMYIDFGNVAEVSDAGIAVLQPRWLCLPAQATPCRLAGVLATGPGDAFRDIVLDKIMKAHVIARAYDELTVELFDLEDFSVAEQLSLISGTTLEPYKVEDDSRRLFLHVPA